MTVYYEHKPDEPLSQSQLKMLEELKNSSAEPDDDCPELSEEQLRAAVRKKRAARRDRTVTLNISQQALDNAQLLGEGYTDILGGILEKLLQNKDMRKKLL